MISTSPVCDLFLWTYTSKYVFSVFNVFLRPDIFLKWCTETGLFLLKPHDAQYDPGQSDFSFHLIHILFI